MARPNRAVFLGVMLTMAAPAHSQAPAEEVADPQERLKHQIVLHLDPHEHPDCAHCLFAAGQPISPDIDNLNVAAGVSSVRHMDDHFHDSDVERQVGNFMRALDAERRHDPEKQRRVNREALEEVMLENFSTYILDIDETLDAAAVAELYKALPGVLDATPQPTITLLAWLPNDPYFYSKGSWGQVGGYNDLWGLYAIGAAGAWQTTLGWPAVVAITDTGVDWRHPDLHPNILWRGSDPLNFIDDDGNGYVDDLLSGYDFYNRAYDVGDGTPACPWYGGPQPAGQWGGHDWGQACDFEEHGTHVAGTVAGAANGWGIVGVAPQARWMPIRIFGFSGSATFQQDYAIILAGVFYAALYGADIINASWGCAPNCGLKPIFDAAYHAGVTTVVAAGNEGASIPNSTQPASLEHSVLTVSASHQNHGRTFFSSFGSQVDVIAPGGAPGGDTCLCNFNGFNHGNWCASTSRNILSTRSLVSNNVFQNGVNAAHCSQDFNRNLNFSDHSLFIGTSMASPHAAGVAALIQSRHWWAGPREIGFFLRRSARDVIHPGWDQESGYGLVKADRALGTAAIITYEDSWVTSGNPNDNHGGDDRLRVDGANPTRISYMKFDLRGIEAHQGAALRVCSKSGASSPNGGWVHTVDPNAWSEYGVKWNNRPALMSGAIALVEEPVRGHIQGDVCTVTDITPWVRPRQLNSLALVKTGGDAMSFHSRETGAAPHMLVVPCRANGCGKCDGVNAVLAGSPMIELGMLLALRELFVKARRRRKR